MQFSEVLKTTVSGWELPDEDIRGVRRQGLKVLGHDVSDACDHRRDQSRETRDYAGG